MNRKQLVEWLDQKLNLPAFSSDHSNNGLQVEGAEEVKLIAFAVDGCLETFVEAAQREADFIFVHHGISWGSEPRRFTGTVAKQLELLFSRSINLYAAHLPLDAQPEFGNNAELCRLAGIEIESPFFRYDGVDIGFYGKFKEMTGLRNLQKQLNGELGCESQLLENSQMIHTYATVVSGGAGLESIEQVAKTQARFLLTGELTHVMYHQARENGIAVLALGHYASEKTGPKALMQRIEQEFGVRTVFIDVPTGL